VRGVRAGELDAVQPPVAPLDILAQQIVAACAAEPWKETRSSTSCAARRPTRSLAQRLRRGARARVEGIETGRGRRAAYVHRDRVNGVLRGRRGARLAALTSGGAIPETADYRVVADPDDTVVGTVNEDWAIESMAGDVFLLGSTSWQIRRVEDGRRARARRARRAADGAVLARRGARAQPRALAPGVGAARRGLAPSRRRRRRGRARRARRARAGLDAAGARSGRPISRRRTRRSARCRASAAIVVERFFDESGGMQLVMHAPFGGRINRALGLVARKRICRAFDFELQARRERRRDRAVAGSPAQLPARDDRVAPALAELRETLAQAVLASPMFTARWRWNLGRALAVLRFRGGRKNPPPIQRMEATT
jgi:ATP-dependent Lhr-like helicase